MDPITALLALVPAQYALYASAAVGTCAVLSAVVPPPKNPVLANFWHLVVVAGFNILHAKNADPAPAAVAMPVPANDPAPTPAVLAASTPVAVSPTIASASVVTAPLPPSALANSSMAKAQAGASMVRGILAAAMPLVLADPGLTLKDKMAINQAGAAALAALDAFTSLPAGAGGVDEAKAVAGAVPALLGLLHLSAEQTMLINVSVAVIGGLLPAK
jgi:hypothetical protein